MTEAFREIEASQLAAFDELKGLDPRAQLEVLLRRFVSFSARQPALAAIIVSQTLKGGTRLAWLVKTSAQVITVDRRVRRGW